MATTDLAWAMTEVVRTKAMPMWMNQPTATLLDLIETGEVEKITERDFRIPAETVPPGRFGAYDPHFGDRGRGTSGTGTYMTASFFSLRLNFEVSEKEIKLAKVGKDKVMYDKLKKALAGGFKEFRHYVNNCLFTDGTAKLATATAHAASGGKSTYTLDTAHGTKLLRQGQYLIVYDTTGATQRGTLYIEALNHQARTMRLSGTVTGAAADDTFYFEGVSGATPAGLNGIYYVNNTATTGTTFGVNRATYPEIQPSSIDGSAGLLPELPMALYHRMVDKRSEIAGGIIGLCPFAQQATIVSRLVAIQNVDISGGRMPLVDRLPKLKNLQRFQYGDITMLPTREQKATRIDLLAPTKWGKAQLAGMQFAEDPDGKRFYTLYGGSGAPAAGTWFGYTCDENFYNIDPGCQGVMYSLPLPATGFYG